MHRVFGSYWPFSSGPRLIGAFVGAVALSVATAGCHGSVTGSAGDAAEPPGSDSGEPPASDSGDGPGPTTDGTEPGTDGGDSDGGDPGDGGDPTDGGDPGDGDGDGSPPPPGGDVDEFDGTRLDAAWSVLRPGLIDISVGAGQLAVTPNQYSVWYNDEAGALIHKSVSGNFKLTTLVRARRASNPSEPVGPWYQFGGIMALDPTTSAHNYVFIVVGDRGEYLAVETKSTRDGRSDVQGPAWSSGDAELRLCRLGSDFLLFKREVGATAWTEAVRYSRPDLPGTLQVGPFAYAYTSRPDVRASFEWVSLAAAATEADCTAPDR